MNGLHGIVFAYKNRSDLRELTQVRAAASIPFGGRHRAIDFVLSTLVNAGVTDVGLVLYGQYQSLLDHVGTGKDWNLSRKRGGLRLLPLFSDEREWGTVPFRGKMEVLGSVRSYLQQIRQDDVVLMDGDLVANLPLKEIYEAHQASGADITVVCGSDSTAAPDGTYIQADEEGRVREVLFRLHAPRGRRSMEVFLLSKELLLELVEECAAHDQFSFRRDVLQARKDQLNIRTYLWEGYVAQFRSVVGYYERSMQLLCPAVRRELFHPDRPIRAKGEDKSSTYIGADGVCINSLVAEGCNIEGRVENSVLFPGVTVAAGAEVRNCILFKETSVGSGTLLSHIIADKRVRVNPNRTLMGHAAYPVVLAKESVI